MSGSNKHISITPVAKAIPYDDTIQTPLSNEDDVQGILDWLKNRVAVSASPGFTWGRSGTVNQNTWFQNDSVPSNTSGRVCFLINASIGKIFVANQDATSGIEIEFYTHDGDSVNLTLIGTVTTVATRSNTFTVSYPVALNKQIAVKLKSGSTAGSNMVIGCLIKGDIA